MESASDNSFHQTKTPISFLYKLRLNLKSLIQLSKTLPVEVIRTYSPLEIFEKMGTIPFQ